MLPSVDVSPANYMSLVLAFAIPWPLGKRFTLAVPMIALTLSLIASQIVVSILDFQCLG